MASKVAPEEGVSVDGAGTDEHRGREGQHGLDTEFKEPVSIRVDQGVDKQLSPLSPLADLQIEAEADPRPREASVTFSDNAIGGSRSATVAVAVAVGPPAAHREAYERPFPCQNKECQAFHGDLGEC